MSTNAPSSPDIAFELDRSPIKSLHVLIALVCGAGLGLDIYEMFLGGALSAVFSSAPHVLPARELSWLLSSVYVGAIFGTPVWGWWADRRGRRAALSLVLLWVGLVSLAIVRSHGATELTVLRALSGVGLGAYPPVMMAYLTDQLPPRQRGSLVLAVSALASLGAPLSMFVVRGLGSASPLGLESWRWAFLVGGSGALLVSAAFWLLPESPRWLHRAGRGVEASAAYARFSSSRALTSLEPAAASPTSESVRPPSTAAGLLRPRLFTLALSLLAPWTTTAFPLISGAVLVQKGFKLPDTLLFMGLGLLGPMLSNVAAAPFVDRLERRVALAVFSGGSLAAIALFVGSHEPTLLVAAFFAFGLFAALYTPALTLYVAELFPTQVRAEASSSAWAVNRLGSAAAPLLLLPLIRGNGAVSALALIAGLWLLSVLLLTVAPAGRQRRAVS